MVSTEIIQASSSESRKTGGISEEIIIDWSNGKRETSNQTSNKQSRPKQQAHDLLGKLSPPTNKSFTPPPSQPPANPEREYIRDVSGKL